MDDAPIVFNADGSFEIPPLRRMRSLNADPLGVRDLKHSKSAEKRLAELHFDPIEELVDQYGRVLKKITAIEEEFQGQAMGTKVYYLLEKYYNTLNKIANDLVAYGYAKQATTNIVDMPTIPPMMIGLADGTEVTVANVHNGKQDLPKV